MASRLHEGGFRRGAGRISPTPGFLVPRPPPASKIGPVLSTISSHPFPTQTSQVHFARPEGLPTSEIAFGQWNHLSRSDIGVFKDAYDRSEGIPTNDAFKLENVLRALGVPVPPEVDLAQLMLEKVQQNREDLLLDKSGLHLEEFLDIVDVLRGLQNLPAAEREIRDITTAFMALGGKRDRSGRVSFKSLERPFRDVGLDFDLRIFAEAANIIIDDEDMLDFTNFTRFFIKDYQRRNPSMAGGVLSASGGRLDISDISDPRAFSPRSSTPGQGDLRDTPVKHQVEFRPPSIAVRQPSTNSVGSDSESWAQLSDFGESEHTGKRLSMEEGSHAIEGQAPEHGCGRLRKGLSMISRAHKIKMKQQEQQQVVASKCVPKIDRARYLYLEKAQQKLPLRSHAIPRRIPPKIVPRKPPESVTKSASPKENNTEVANVPKAPTKAAFRPAGSGGGRCIPQPPAVPQRRVGSARSVRTYITPRYDAVRPATAPKTLTIRKAESPLPKYAVQRSQQQQPPDTLNASEPSPVRVQPAQLNDRDLNRFAFDDVPLSSVTDCDIDHILNDILERKAHLKALYDKALATTTPPKAGRQSILEEQDKMPSPQKLTPSHQIQYFRPYAAPKTLLEGLRLPRSWMN